MPQEILPDTLPAFYKLGTIADMSQLARKLALARKAIGEIRRIEDYMEARKTNLSESDFALGMKETRDYAVIAANAVREAIVIVRGIKSKVESYQESIHDVID